MGWKKIQIFSSKLINYFLESFTSKKILLFTILFIILVISVFIYFEKAMPNCVNNIDDNFNQTYISILINGFDYEMAAVNLQIISNITDQDFYYGRVYSEYQEHRGSASDSLENCEYSVFLGVDDNSRSSQNQNNYSLSKFREYTVNPKYTYEISHPINEFFVLKMPVYFFNQGSYPYDSFYIDYQLFLYYEEICDFILDDEPFGTITSFDDKDVENLEICVNAPGWEVSSLGIDETGNINLLMKRSIFVRLIFPVLFTLIFFLILNLTKLDDISTIIQVTSSILFGIWGIREVVFDNNVLYPDLLNFFFGILYIFLTLVSFFRISQLLRQKSKR